MSTRPSRLFIEARLYIYLLLGVLVLYPWFTVASSLAVCCVLGAFALSYADANLFAVAVLLLLVSAPVWFTRPGSRSVTRPAAEPESEAIAQYPALKELADQIATDLSLPAPDRVHFRLSPIFRHWGAPEDPDDRELGSRTLRLDLSRLGVCSVFEFRCDIAKAILQPRMSPWLARRVLAQIDLLAERIKRGTYGIAAMKRFVWMSMLRERELNSLRAWRLFAEMETDRALAALFGKRCVAAWIEKSWFAEWVFPVYQQIWLEPAWRRGYLPPMMEGFRRLHEETGGEWLMDTDADRPVNLRSKYEIGEIARWQPHRMRLIALDAFSDMAGESWDGRPASLLLDGANPEVRVARKALVSDALLGGDEPLTAISWEAYPKNVVLAEIDDMLLEESDLFDGRSLRDLPAIVRKAPYAADEEVHMPFLPPQFEHRLASMPNSLSGFLIKNLLARGWQMRFELSKGLRLMPPDGGGELDPNRIVHDLAVGSVTEEDFARRVRLLDRDDDVPVRPVMHGAPGGGFGPPAEG
ncbi:MAG: hypothetical protein LC114_12540 [Bryobacterales bacterium]|nr:hypothetical protein [Bryobacterales bacterium]